MRFLSFRAFVSVDLEASDSIRTFLSDLRESGRGLKVVAPEQLHLTLKFLGDTQEGLIPDILEIVRRSCLGVGSFGVKIRGTGAFPNLTRMRVVWVGVEGAQALGTVARRLEEGLGVLGYPRESREWTPHVTIGRVRGRDGLDRARASLELRKDEDFGEQIVSEVRLKKSVLTPGGSVYSTVGVVALGDRPA